MHVFLWFGVFLRIFVLLITNFVAEKEEVEPEGRAVSQTSAEHKYHFLEHPPSDSLLQPHQTKYYGNLLSQEAATKIERERGPWVCPLCNEPHLSTTLSQLCPTNNTKN